jgi:hypothetical protein
MDKVWFVTMHTGYCGSDGHDILVMPEDATDEEVQDAAREMALENIAMYGYYPLSEGSDDWEDEDEMDTDGDNVSNNSEGYAVPYDPELHDMYRSGGGSFMNDCAYKTADL